MTRNWKTQSHVTCFCSSAAYVDGGGTDSEPTQRAFVVLDFLTDDTGAFEVLEEDIAFGGRSWDDPDDKEFEYGAESDGFKYARYRLEIWLRSVKDYTE